MAESTASVIGPTFSHSLYVGMMIQTFGLTGGIDFLDAAGSRPRIPRLSPPLLALQPNRGQSGIRAQRNAQRNRFDRFCKSACTGRFDLRRQGVRGLLAGGGQSDQY